jgi:hypothetical protein
VRREAEGVGLICVGTQCNTKVALFRFRFPPCNSFSFHQNAPSAAFQANRINQFPPKYPFYAILLKHEKIDSMLRLFIPSFA